MKVCKRCNRSRKIYAKGVCKSCYNTLHPSKKMVICKMCNELKIHNGNGLCKSCYSKMRWQIPELKIIHSKQIKDWKEINHERVLEQGRKDDANRKGTPKRLASKRKSNSKRERSLGDIPMFDNPFNNSVKVEWHHITDVYTVAIPKDLHELYTGYKMDKHREMTMEIIKQIYLMGE